jgi:hypothetical protein
MVQNFLVISEKFNTTGIDYFVTCSRFVTLSTETEAFEGICKVS